MRHRRGRVVVAAALVPLLLAACSGSDAADEPLLERPAGSGGAAAAPVAPAAGADAAYDGPDDPALDVALSEPVEDSVYPLVGDPGVDALHYDLDLAWDPDARVLTGRQTLLLRATEDADELQLDLSEALQVDTVRLDGEEVDFRHEGKDLVVVADVTADERYELVLDYAGTPLPVPAPTTRSDYSTNGWTTMPDGSTWTMQEPHGAYTWYAVNDQPADKALYDLTISVPEPFTGIANGELVDTVEADGVRTTTWHLAEPAASYLMTIATGDYVLTEDESASGVPIQYWVPRESKRLARTLAPTPEGLAWLEERLGPYPFDTLGILLVDSESGMETQTMITLGMTDYATSPKVVVHELAHHWYGNEVTPSDWRDVWMNEGMAMYLQGLWEAEQDGYPVNELMDYWASFEDEERAAAGPPADYDPTTFGESNIYYGPALMWHELRRDLGDKVFFELVRAWPAEHQNSSSDYDEITSWWSERAGRDLSGFFEDWLLGRTTPARG